MTKKDRIQYILNLMVEELENILENESLRDLSAEDIVQLALEVSTNNITQPSVKKPMVAEIDRNKVQFVIDDEFQVPLGGELITEDDYD